MAYNHGRAERKWKLWKEKEEKILRDSGASEDMIEAIRLYDRQAFNTDRRYYERVQETGTYLILLQHPQIRQNQKQYRTSWIVLKIRNCNMC